MLRVGIASLRLWIRGSRALCSCAASHSRVKRVYGSPLQSLRGFSVPLDSPTADQWPGDYPIELCKYAFGIDLGISTEQFRSEMFEAVEKNLSARPHGASDYQEWLATGRSNGSNCEFVALAIPPRTAFFVHQHPGIELVYLIRGSMQEIRLEQPAHIDRQCKEQYAPYDLCDPSYRFARREFRANGGRWIANEVGSVHQTFTEDEACLMIAVWPGRYVIFKPEQLPDGVFTPVNHDISLEDTSNFGQGARRI